MEIHLITLLAILLGISELLPFLRFLHPKFKHIHSIIILFYYILQSVFNVVTCKFCRDQQEKKQLEKQERIKAMIRQIIRDEDKQSQTELDIKVSEISRKVEIISDLVV